MVQKIKLMGHIVAGYPNMRSCIYAGTGIMRGGASFLEVQFPFSDGNADGTLIQSASDYSLHHGFTPENGFAVIDALVHGTAKDILAMTYANIVLNYGVEKFVKKLKECGAYGIIVPDFTFGEDDFSLRRLCEEYGLYFIELVAPLTPYERIREIAKATKSPFIYVIARNGLTGAKTQIDSAVLEYIQEAVRVCALESKQVMVGFGINHKSQLEALQGKVYGVVAGSYFVNVINQNIRSENLDMVLQEATQELLQI